jgi:hypothetical protein
VAAARVIFEALDRLRDAERDKAIESITEEDMPTIRPFSATDDPFRDEPVAAKPNVVSRVFQSLFGKSKKDAPSATETVPDPDIVVGPPVPVPLPEIEPEETEPDAGKTPPPPEAPSPSGEPGADGEKAEADVPSSQDAPTSTEGLPQLQRRQPDPEVEVEPLPDVDLELLPDLAPDSDLPEFEASLWEVEKTATGDAPGPGVRDPKGRLVPAKHVSDPAEKRSDQDQTPKADERPGLRWDRWLARAHTGENRPDWAEVVVEPLKKMLDSKDPAVRLAAARPLIALGHRDVALPVVLKAVTDQHGLYPRAATVLAWLPWEQRAAFVDELRALAATDEDQQELIGGFSQMLDHRAANRLWTLLADPSLTVSMAEILDEGLSEVYYGYSYRADEVTDKGLIQEIVDAARPRAAEGQELQRLVALVQMARIAPQESIESARQIIQDEDQSVTLRRDAFQIELAVSGRKERQEAALAVLSDKDSPLQLIALRALVLGGDSLGYLRGYVFWIPATDYDDDSAPVVSDSLINPIIPKPPKGLELEQVLPLLGDPDGEVRALAGYVAVLHGNRKGLAPLIDFWRLKPDDEDIARLLYRAIAALDDSSRLAELREIYRKLETYQVSEFYWTIRIMSGPQVLQFRKQIRDEVGMDELR